jgi:hypothetical protein
VITTVGGGPETGDTSKESIVEVISKALVDAWLRTQLLAEAEVAPSGYELTEEERAALSTLEEDTPSHVAARVEERFSKDIPRPLDGIGMEPGQMAQMEKAVREGLNLGRTQIDIPQVATSLLCGGGDRASDALTRPASGGGKRPCHVGEAATGLGEA